MQPPVIVLAGQLRRQTLLPPTGRPLLDVPGGNLLYAASGARLWRDAIGLTARVGEDYPHDWLRQFADLGLDTAGIRQLLGPLDLRSFLAYTDLTSAQKANPVSHFARLHLPFPKGLLGYQPVTEQQDSRARPNVDSPRISDIPDLYLEAKAVHLCPLDFVAHTQLIPAFRQKELRVVCVDPGAGYMNPNFLNDLRSMLADVTAFLPSEEEIRALFWGRTNDLWEMAEALAAFGVDYIVIKRGALGQMLYDATRKQRWEIPAYPARLIDLTGAGDAFCGGFLAELAGKHDPLQAALRGNVSASLAVEGSGAFFALESTPGLANARVQSLSEIIRRV
jgi:sugar/nucleoside kinase (ribokinase family)